MKCKIESCERQISAKDFCGRHYDQIRRLGYIFGNPKRSNRIKNAYRIIGSDCFIDLYNIRGQKVAETKIDIDDLERVKSLKWGINNGYATHHYGKKQIKLSNYIMRFKSGQYFMIDHINRDKLDNKKNNLRIVNKSLNNINRNPQKNNTSGYTGVYWDKQHQIWEVRFRHEYIGITKNKIQAIEMRKQAKNAYQNIIDQRD